MAASFFLKESMEVVLDKKYPVAAGVDAAWVVLADMHELATCMPGAQITEDIDATHYKGSVRGAGLEPATFPV